MDIYIYIYIYIYINCGLDMSGRLYSTYLEYFAYILKFLSYVFPDRCGCPTSVRLMATLHICKLLRSAIRGTNYQMLCSAFTLCIYTIWFHFELLRTKHGYISIPNASLNLRAGWYLLFAEYQARAFSGCLPEVAIAQRWIAIEEMTTPDGARFCVCRCVYIWVCVLCISVCFCLHIW